MKTLVGCLNVQLEEDEKGSWSNVQALQQIGLVCQLILEMSHQVAWNVIVRG